MAKIFNISFCQLSKIFNISFYSLLTLTSLLPKIFSTLLVSHLLFHPRQPGDHHNNKDGDQDYDKDGDQDYDKDCDQD